MQGARPYTGHCTVRIAVDASQTTFFADVEHIGVDQRCDEKDTDRLSLYVSNVDDPTQRRYCGRPSTIPF